MGDVYGDLERMQDEANRRARPWRFRADFFHDSSLPPGTWAVDGEPQEAQLTEDNLLAAVNREGKKPTVTVSAPLHLVIGRIIGFTPPYL